MNRGRSGFVALLVAGALAAPACAQRQGEAMVVSSDAELAAIAESLLPQLAERSGLPLTGPVRLERRNRAQLTRYLQAQLDEQLPVDEAKAVVDAYALLGLVPADLDLREMLLGLYTEQVAGFYEPDSTALFVMEDQARADLEGLLIHELVHAIQDQNADLSALTDPEVGSDRAAAAQAAIEGHATLVMMEFIVEQQLGTRVDLGAFPDFSAQLRPLLEGVRGDFPALDNAPRVVQEMLLFPYLEGAAFVQALWADGERLAPFGDYLPVSSEQIIERALDDPPVEIALSVTGGRVVDEDVLGRVMIDVLLDEHVGSSGRGLGRGWEGDRYALVEQPDDSRGLVWCALWETADERDRFGEALVDMTEHFGGPASVERIEVAGLPATLLRVGEVDEIGVTATVMEAP